MDQRIKHGLKIFYLLSIIAASFILYYTASPDTLNALFAARFPLLFAALLLAFSASAADFMRLYMLIRGLGEKVPFLFGLELTFANNFFSAVTPFATGGGALQVYMMHEIGIPVAKGIAATVMKFIQAILFLGIASPVILLFFPGLVSSTNLKLLLAWTALSFFFIVLFYTTVIFWPAMTRSLVALILQCLRRLHLIKQERAERWYHKIIHIINEFNTSFRSYFGRARWYLAASFGFTMLYFAIQFFIPVVLMWAFRQNVNILTVMTSQLVLTAVMYFVPTPGSSGIAEGGFAFLFIRYVPKHILGVLVLIWRFLHTYMGVTIGSYIFLKILGNVTMNTILNVSAEKPVKTPEGLVNGPETGHTVVEESRTEYPLKK